MTASSRSVHALISIIVLTKNGDKYLDSVLSALFQQDRAKDSEVIVIDSGSTDRTLEILSSYPVKLVQIPACEFGHGKTRNLGAALAQGEFLVFLPQDATPLGRSWLAALLLPFSNPSVGGVFSRQIPREEATAMEKFFLLTTYHENPEIKNVTREEECSLSTCFFSNVGAMIRGKLLKRYPFKEDVIMSEDQAWAKEVMLAGYSIAYAPTACVLHSHHYGVVDIFRRNFDSGYSIRQIFSGRTGVSMSRFARFLLEEVLFVTKQARLADHFLLVPYEVARHAGFAMGLHAEKLPFSLRKRCGKLKYFWDSFLTREH